MFTTGNNLSVHGDMTRRTLMCRMDAKMERPEQRTFEHDLRDEALRRRPALVSALLTIIRWGHSWQEEFPDPWERAADAKPLAGYRRWCRVVRDPLVALGLKDPVLSVDDVRATDDQEEGLSTLLMLWYSAFHKEAKTTRFVYDNLIGYPALLDAVKTVTRDLELKVPANSESILVNIWEDAVIPCVLSAVTSPMAARLGWLSRMIRHNPVGPVPH